MKTIIDFASASAFIFSSILLCGAIEGGSADAISIALLCFLASAGSLARKEILKWLNNEK